MESKEEDLKWWEAFALIALLFIVPLLVTAYAGIEWTLIKLVWKEFTK